MHIYIYICIYIYTYVHDTHLYLYIYICMYVCMYIKVGGSLLQTLSALCGTSLKKLPNIPIGRMCKYVYTYTHVCMCIYVCTIQRTGASIVINEKFITKRKYEMTSLLLDTPVYTDRKIRWIHIPPLLINAHFISTANNDKVSTLKCLYIYILLYAYRCVYASYQSVCIHTMFLLHQFQWELINYVKK